MAESSFLNCEWVSVPGGGEGGRVVARVRCEKIGTRESQILDAELREIGPKSVWKIALDMSDVRVLSSMGIGMLVTLHKACRGQNGVMVIWGLSPELLNLLQVTHLHKVLRVVSSRQEALGAIK